MILLAPLVLPPTLAVDGFVVGARTGGRWRAVSIGQGWKSRPAALFRPIGVARVGAPVRLRFTEEDVPQGVYVAEPQDARLRVLVAGTTPRAPRRATEIPATNPAYVRAFRGYLDRNGLRAARVRITRIVGADLDGDGTQEVLIEAQSSETAGITNVAAGFGPNDYSVVLLRALRGGKVVEFPLATGKTPAADGLRRKLRAIADLDGDGRMEIVLSWDAWEAGGGALWSYRSGRATRLIESGTGV